MTPRALRPVAAVLVGPAEQRNNLESAEQALFLDQGDTAYKFQRFGLLLTLAAIIASGGIVMDSTVVLIGGMIVAPMAVPIMGVAQVTTGMGVRLRTAVLGVVVGGAGLRRDRRGDERARPARRGPAGESPMASRIQPGIVDLIVALATGVVASVAVIRKDISDVLPGVAIAISLVPAMCVTGMYLVRGLFDAALGATTLFATNVLAMILAGVVIFSLVGYARDAAARQVRGVSRRRSSTVVAAALLVVPLAAQTWESVIEARMKFGAEQAATEWIGELNGSGGSWVLREVRFLPDLILVEILGSGPQPETAQLLGLMSGQVLPDVQVEVDVSDGNTIRAGTTYPGAAAG